MPVIAPIPPVEVAQVEMQSHSNKPVTADEAMEKYHSMVSAGRSLVVTCPKQVGELIIVCGRRKPDPRLPLPDVRFEAGEVTHHPGEPPSAMQALQGPQSGQPSRLGETAGKIMGIINGLITGEDRGF